MSGSCILFLSGVLAAFPIGLFCSPRNAVLFSSHVFRPFIQIARKSPGREDPQDIFTIKNNNEREAETEKRDFFVPIWHLAAGEGKQVLLFFCRGDFPLIFCNMKLAFLSRNEEAGKNPEEKQSISFSLFRPIFYPAIPGSNSRADI